VRRTDVTRPRDVPDLVDDDAGLGVAELPCFRADTEPELVRLMARRCNHFDVWLVAHADLYKTARVQAVIEAVVDEFASAAPAAR